MLFYGVVSLLPPRTKRGKKAKKRLKLEPILAIIAGLSGLGLCAWAFMWNDATAKAIFKVFFCVWVTAGVVIWVVGMRKRKHEKE